MASVLDLSETLDSLEYDVSVGVLNGYNSIKKKEFLKKVGFSFNKITSLSTENIYPIPRFFSFSEKEDQGKKNNIFSLQSVKSMISSFIIDSENKEQKFEELLHEADLILDACMSTNATLETLRKYTSAPIIYNHAGSPDTFEKFWIKDKHLPNTEIKKEERYNAFCKRYDGILFQADDQAEECIKRGAMSEDNCFVLSPSCQEIKVLASKQLENPYKNDRNHIVYVGSIQPRKAQHFAIESFSLIADTFPDTDLHFVGGGIDTNYGSGLLKQINELDLQKRIFFHGHRNDYLRFMAHTDIIVQSSKSEGVSRVLREAMLLKVPIVSFAISGTTSILEKDKDALLVEPENVRDMADGIRKLLENKRLANSLSEAAFRKYLLNHSWAVYSNNVSVMIRSFIR